MARVRQPRRVASYEALPPHTEWRWTEPAGFLGPKDYNEVGPVEYGHAATVSAWRDEESGVLVTRVSISSVSTA